MADDTVIHEWRVTGQLGDEFDPYEYTWRSSDPAWPDAEAAAWAFVDKLTGEWTDVRVQHRTITATPWADAGRPESHRLKSAHSCRLCSRWLEGEWNVETDPDERAALQRQMDQGRCDICPPRVRRG